MVELFAAPYITEPNIQSVSWYYIFGEMVLFEGYYISVLLENMARNRSAVRLLFNSIDVRPSRTKYDPCRKNIE